MLATITHSMKNRAKPDTTTSKQQPLLLGACIFSIALTALFFMMDRSINVYDEGIILTGAMRVLNGELIHRDFYANYGPANFYLLAWIFKIFGTTIFIERLLDLCIRAAIVAVIFHIISAKSSFRYAIAGATVAGLWLGSVGLYGYPVYPALLLALASVQKLSQVTNNSQNPFHPLIAGILTGLCALFRYDVGFFLMLANLLAMSYVQIYMKDPSKNTNKLIHNIALYVTGSAPPVLIVLTWYASTGALSGFMHDVISYPTQYYADQRALPFPGLTNLLNLRGLVNLAIYLPILFVALVPWVLLGSTCSTHRARLSMTVFLCMLSTFMYLKGIVRVSVQHMQISLLPAIIGATLMTAQFERHPGKLRTVIRFVALVFMLTAMATAAKWLIFNPNLVIKDPITFFQMARASTWTIVDATSKAGTTPRETSAFLVDAQRGAALRYLSNNTTPSDTVFVGLARHDKIFVNDVSAYFLTQRQPATKWHHFDPGLQTSLPTQQAIVAELEVHKPPFIWLESTWNDVSEPNASAVSSGVKVLDQYIIEHYKSVRQFGTIYILQRAQ